MVQQLLQSTAVAMACSVLVSGEQVLKQRPNFEGTWNSATTTPLERPPQLKNKPFFTREEAAEWERQYAKRNAEPTPEQLANSKGTGTYNTFYREWGTRVVKTLRTSIITDPPDGRIPALTPEAEAIRRRRIEGIKNGENPEELGLQDQCLAFLTAGPPLLPYSYNSNYQIVQTDTAILVHAEMIHDARIIHLDGRPHPPPSVRKWNGDSVGRWEANTLVVDTTNFNDRIAVQGSSAALHVVERFRRVSAEKILYQYTVDDPTTWTRPWSAEIPMMQTEGPLFEYACHEGNYGLVNILRGARVADKEAARTPQR